MPKEKGIPRPFLQKSGYWGVRETGADGKSKPHSFKTKDKQEAERLYALYMAKRSKVIAEELSDHKSVHWCLNHYIEKVAPGLPTERRCIRILTTFKDCIPATTLVKELKERHFDAWKAKRRAGPFRKGYDSVSDSTLRTELLVFLAALNCTAGKQNGLLKADIPDFISGKDEDGFLPPPGAPRAEYLSHAEADHLLEVFKTAPHGQGKGKIHFNGKLPPLYILGEILYGTGRRVEAVGKLEWTKINQKSDPWLIDFRRNGRETNRKIRGIARVPSRLKAVLQRAWEERDRSSPLVLGREQGWTSIFQRYAIKAGFSKVNKQGKVKASIGPHTMRHTYISLALQAGVPIANVSKAVGCSISTIEKVYGHLTNQNLMDVGEAATGGDRVKKAKLRTVQGGKKGR